MDLLTHLKDPSFTGFSIKDAGKLLYSDFGGGYINRQEAKKLVASHIQALATQRGLMVDTGNFYLVKNADIIVNLPVSTYYKESAAYEPVPAAPIILHGIADYSGKPVNLSGDRQKAMLKSIEYGMLPYYEWVFDSDSTLYYNPYITEAVEFYKKSEKMLSDLRTSAITMARRAAGRALYPVRHRRGNLCKLQFLPCYRKRNYGSRSGLHQGKLISKGELLCRLKFRQHFPQKNILRTRMFSL